MGPVATALTGATLHPWVQSQGWHAEGCNMSEHIINLERMHSWVLLQLQPEKHDNILWFVTRASCQRSELASGQCHCYGLPVQQL